MTDLAWLGTAWQGKARPGMARQGKARQGKDCTLGDLLMEMEMGMETPEDQTLRREALGQAVRTHGDRPGDCKAGVVEAAKAYYEFLKGQSDD